MRKAKLLPLYFEERNKREETEFNQQLLILKKIYTDVADFLDPIPIGKNNVSADAIVFPQLIGAAFHHSDSIKKYNLPAIVLTSKFGTVEMWDWEIVTYLREKGLNIYSPYEISLAKVIIRSITAKKTLNKGAKFLMFQDSPGEGMQAYIFKRFFWWEDECTKRLKESFGIGLIYKSYKELNIRAENILDKRAEEELLNWDYEFDENLTKDAKLLAVKLYLAVKDTIKEVGNIEGVGANCLNESFNSKTTPCLAWNRVFEKDDIIFACEGDTLTMISTFILYRSLIQPVMMTNLYPFLVGMAALAHEKIDKFPEIDRPSDHALGVHCGYFGFAPKSFCKRWICRPKVLEIVNKKAHVIDCEFELGKITLAKIYPDLKRFSVIEGEIEKYVQYPDSDCRNGALIRWKNGYDIMEHLCSHHSLIIKGHQLPALKQIAKTFDFDLILP
ncbi:MAG: hypothetical protein LBD41_06075 [Clostridiales Family XIII bacterium]|jgi:hypothetical protein|nr:hypothetical protein [Clostridiales Family XIII bacterium]